VCSSDLVANGVKVDCALAKPYNDTDVTEVLLKGDSDYEPYVYTTGVKKPHSNERVVKSGARTGCCEVVELNRFIVCCDGKLSPVFNYITISDLYLSYWLAW